MARKERAKAKLLRTISENSKGRGFRSQYRRRTAPHKWVVKTDYLAQMVGGKEVRVATYVVVGLNHAGYMASIALRTKDKDMAIRGAALLNKRAVEG